MSDEQASAAGPGIADVTMIIQRLRPMFSGQGVQVEELCRELARRGVRVTILTAGHGRQPRWEEIHGYRVRRLRCDLPLLSRWLRPGRFRSELFALKALWWLLLHGWRTEVIHVHAQTDALYAAWLFSRLRRVPLVFEMTLLGADDAAAFAANTHRFRRLRNAIFRRCDGYVAISPALARVYREAGLPEDRLRLLPQAVDTDRFRPADDRQALRRRLGLDPNGPIVLFVGSLIERKGIDVLLEAWQRIHEHAPDATLVMVGVNSFPDDPAAASFLDRHLDRLSDAARARTVQAGVQETVEDWLGAANVFVFPSRREGFGTVMIEAMASAVPAVVAELPDITDFIFGADQTAGTIVAQQDASALAAAVVALLDDPARARELAEAGRWRVIERFALRRVADDYLRFYAALRGTREGN